MTESDCAELYRLEHLLALTGKRPTHDKLEHYIADDFSEHGAAGKIWTKPTVIEAMQTWSSFERTIADFQVRALSDIVALVTYKSDRPSGASRHATHSAQGVDLATKGKLLGSGVSSRYASVEMRRI